MLENGEQRTWGEYRRLVITELERLNNEIGKLQQRVNGFSVSDFNQMKISLAKLEASVESKRPHVSSGLLGDSPTVKAIIYALLAMVGALATGSFVQITGLLH